MVWLERLTEKRSGYYLCKVSDSISSPASGQDMYKHNPEVESQSYHGHPQSACPSHVVPV